MNDGSESFGPGATWIDPSSSSWPHSLQWGTA